MKQCAKCGAWKSIEEFVPRKLKTKIGRSSECRPCNYQSSERTRKGRLERRRKRLKRYKTKKGCQRCGYNSHPAALDFHHIEDKTERVSDLITHSIKNIFKEVRKCEVLCTNCHRIEHSDYEWDR